MSVNKIKEYQVKTTAIRKGRTPKYLAARLIEERFSNHKIDENKLRYDINNALFGKSYKKAIELKLMPVINTLYRKTQSQIYARKKNK